MGEPKQVKVIYSSRAVESIANLALYLSSKGYPETASKFYPYINSAVQSIKIGFLFIKPKTIGL